MRAAVIENGVVVNIIEIPQLDDYPGAVACPDENGIGDLFENGVFSQPPTPEPPIPSTVSMYQARIALHQAGLLATVQAGISQMSEEAQIKWEFAPTVKRNDALTVALATALNLTEEDLDNLFTTANSII